MKMLKTGIIATGLLLTAGLFLGNAQSNCATKLVQHAQGETCVPNAPKRIVVLHDAILLEPILSLGMRPIASTVYWLERGIFYRNVDAATTAKIEPIGSITEPNVEKILSLKPDLIIGRPGQHDRLYAQLAKIAPTVYPKEAQTSILEQLRFLGRLLGRETLAEQRIQTYQSRIANFKSRAGRKLSNITISRLRFAGSAVNTFGEADAVVQIINALGIKRPAAQSALKDERVNLSLETLPAHDADYIFVRRVGDVKIENIVPNELWNRLGAVKNNSIIEEDWAAYSVPAAQRVLADLEKVLLR
jgi:iron complex transport system substrate-binding protein